MESGGFALIGYAIFGFFALVALGIAFLIYRLVRKSKFKWLRLIALIPILAFAFLVYRAYVPSDSFYEGHFTSVTGIDFPENGEVLFGEVTGMDEFGDGTYTSISNVGADVLKRVPDSLFVAGYTELDVPNEYIFEKEYGAVIREFSFQEIGNYINVGFLSDGESLFIRINHW